MYTADAVEERPLPTIDAPYIRMLSDLAARADVKAQEDSFGRVKHETKQLKNNLICVEAQFIPANTEDEPGEVVYLFAAGKLKNHSMVKVQRVGTDGAYVFISNSPNALLALLSY